MAELKNMTVQALRDLARKALGRGHSRLKTKSELVAALQAAGRNVSDRFKEATDLAAKAAGRMVESAAAHGRAKAEKKAAARKEEATRKEEAAKKKEAAKKETASKATARKEAARREPPKRAAAPAPKPPRKPEPPSEKEPAKETERVRGRRAEASAAAEPDPESYFVARVAGEDAVRDAPHPMTESALEEQRAAPPEEPRRRHRARPEEDLGELPPSYDEDELVALPRDPRTMFVYWDHHAGTLQNGFAGVEDPRVQLWIFARAGEAWDRIRTLDVALESRGYYVHDLGPGRIYRAEIHVLDRAGRNRLLQAASNEMQLPPFGPSPIIADRFMRLPWGTPLARLLKHYREGGAFPEELRAVLAHLSDWTRFMGPTWGSGSAGGPGGRPGPTSGAVPSSPSSPFGPFGGPSGEGR